MATALIFLLHPVQTEAVTCASGRSTSQSALFALASIAVWVRWREAGEARTVNKLLLYLASLLLMLAAIATKETMVIVPAVLLLWEAADVSRPVEWRGVITRTGIHWLVLVGANQLAAGAPRSRQ